MSTHPLSIAGRVRAARAAAGLSREALAGPLGRSVNTIARVETGEREPKGRELERIAEICDVPMWFLAHGWDGVPSDEAEHDATGQLAAASGASDFRHEAPAPPRLPPLRPRV